MSADKTPTAKAGTKQRLHHGKGGKVGGQETVKSYILREHRKAIAKTYKLGKRSTTSGSHLKVSVTMPEQVLEEARLRAGQGGLSAYVTGAVEAFLAQERLQELIAELNAEYGPVPQDKIAQAAAAWPSSE